MGVLEGALAEREPGVAPRPGDAVHRGMQRDEVVEPPRRAPGYAARLPAEDANLRCKQSPRYRSLNISLISEFYKFDF